MNTSDPRPGEKVKNVRFSDDELIVDLLDGRTISVPLAWYPRLLHAAPEQREVGNSAVVALVSTGLISTKTSAQRVCFEVLLHPEVQPQLDKAS